MSHQIDLNDIQKSRELVTSALEAVTDVEAHEALQASLTILNQLVDQRQSRRDFAGSMVYTFEDLEYEPHGREIDVRIDYNWNDYNRADEPFAIWGASLENVEVLAVRYLDEAGECVTPGEHLTDVAWNLINEQDEAVTDACTEHGYRQGVGESPYWYSPSSPAANSHSPSEIAARMAGSVPTRAAEDRARRLG